MRIVRKIKKEIFNGSINWEWKKFIKKLIRKYRFDDKVIFTLFEYCKSKEHLEQEYISVVAESWKKNNIIKGQDLENYYIQYQVANKIKNNIAISIIKRNLTIFEETLIKKWFFEYGLNEEDIILALKTSNSFSKADRILFKKYIHR